ncbi:MAG TPA: glucokinase [Hyphomicrobium sp.]|nr:glucokinase [Hyphomicrobium sp.]
MTGWRIVCDAGGTNLRCARSDAPSHLADLMVVAPDNVAGIEDALEVYAARFADLEALEGIAIAAAGPVEDGRVRLTNRDIVIDKARVSRGFANKPVALLNDLEAAAWSLPVLRSSDLAPILERTGPLGGPRLVVNVGTGFGGALLVRTANAWHAIACEPGHMKLAHPWQGGTHIVSVEDVISGLTLSDPGRRQKYWGHVRSSFPVSGGALFSALKAGEAPADFVSAFSRLLGQVCGDLVLACGAWGGVYLCGSVAAAWSGAGGTVQFQSAFEDKGPMARRMRRVPVFRITAANPVLTGLCQVPFA